MRRLTSLIRRTVVVAGLNLAARLLHLTRRRAAARRTLGRALVLAPDSYAAHHLLARIALAEGARAEAMRELRICARLDPRRLARLDIPGALDGVAETAIGSESLAFPPPDPLGAPDAPGAPGSDGASRTPGDLAPGPPPAGDFSTAAEWERFRDLPPIDAEEIAAVDLDALLEQLVRDPRPRRTRGS